MDEPWTVDDAPYEFTERLVQAIVGIEIKIEALTGKLKASQNQPERNRAGVKALKREKEHITVPCQSSSANQRLLSDSFRVKRQLEGNPPHREVGVCRPGRHCWFSN